VSGVPKFDRYACRYTAGMENPVKRLVGRDADQFINVKVRWLLRHLAEARGVPSSVRLLDYGCGTGAMLRALQRRRFPGTLVGCDASAGMLEEAARGWGADPMPPLHLMEHGRVPVPDASFDVVVISAVLHHTAPDERKSLLSDAIRVVVPGGRLVVFEHNPLNPVTRWVVRRTAIDQDAVLVYAPEVRRLLASLGLTALLTRFMMFVPPRLEWLSALEHRIGRVPLGGQYVVVGERPE
jgi:SAM-dependent methyltransferase